MGFNSGFKGLTPWTILRIGFTLNKIQVHPVHPVHPELLPCVPTPRVIKTYS